MIRPSHEANENASGNSSVTAIAHGKNESVYTIHSRALSMQEEAESL